MVAVTLTVAGSDSGGGAGIQADLRTFAFHRVHGTSAITCVTAQNTTGVERVDALPPEAVVAQLTAIVSDIGVNAAKTGMLLNRDIILAVAEQVATAPIAPLVVDPVMVSRSGAQLIADAAIAALRSELVPQAAILTPNRYEAQILCGGEIDSLDAMKRAAETIRALGATAVLVKGGAMPGALQGTDVWFDGDRLEVLGGLAVPTRNNHGTGCTLSAAIAANLALGSEPFAAVRAAKTYVTGALQHALDIGSGSGPVGHFYLLSERGA